VQKVEVYATVDSRPLVELRKVQLDEVAPDQVELGRVALDVLGLVALGQVLPPGQLALDQVELGQAAWAGAQEVLSQAASGKNLPRNQSHPHLEAVRRSVAGWMSKTWASLMTTIALLGQIRCLLQRLNHLACQSWL